ncbi:hypothetical protein [Actinocrispum sp. NPDC049592]|uniref:hypothetical protein n=1 Tax=Actinocrispum sp. NPDC049592 TaxID=3154835 RepID=UPI00342BF981
MDGRIRRDVRIDGVVQGVGLTVTEGGLNGFTGFAIVPSDASGQRQTLVSADSATCDDCLRELGDPEDRRFQYPFINCTNFAPPPRISGRESARRSSPGGSTMASPTSSSATAWTSATPTRCPQWHCPVGCSRTCC